MSEITIKELTTQEETARFWEKLHAYFRRDMFPEGEPDREESLDYFLGEEYRGAIGKRHDRPVDRLYYLAFLRSGAEIGYAMPASFPSEDGKWFIMEFWVEPEFRGGGTGTACARALLAWAGARGASYFELNAEEEPRRRFWAALGFAPNGTDEWGNPCMLLPPEEALPLRVERLTDPDGPELGWQLLKLENSFLAEIREEPLTGEKKQRLAAAVREGRIAFFLALRGTRAVGMCSVSPLLLHLCLRGDGGVRRLLRGAPLPPPGRGAAAGPGGPGLVPGAGYGQPDGGLLRRGCGDVPRPGLRPGAGGHAGLPAGGLTARLQKQTGGSAASPRGPLPSCTEKFWNVHESFTFPLDRKARGLYNK